MQLPSLKQIRDAQTVVYRFMPPTPQFSWPLLNQRLKTEAWIKHENHSPVGAFKLRGALVYIAWLKQTLPGLPGVVAATRGNHGLGVVWLRVLPAYALLSLSLTATAAKRIAP